MTPELADGTYPTVGQVFTCDAGDELTNTPGAVVAYTWVFTEDVYDEAEDSYETIRTETGVTGPTYTIDDYVQDRRLNCEVDVTGTTTASFTLNGPWFPWRMPPQLETTIEITGATKVDPGAPSGVRPTVGDELTCDGDEWTPAPTSRSYSWVRKVYDFDSGVYDSTSVGSSLTYIVQADDRGYFLECEITASNQGAESDPEPTDVDLQVWQAKPENVTPPAVTASGDGIVRAGSTLTCDPGTWNLDGDANRYTYWKVGGVFVPGLYGRPSVVVPETWGGLTVGCVDGAENLLWAWRLSSGVRPLYVTESASGLRNVPTRSATSGADKLYGGSGADNLSGGRGNDIIDGGSSNDKLFGGPGRDTITGGSGKDTIDGGADADTLNGGTEKDTIKGGTGNDTINSVDGKTTVDVIYCGSGRDTVTANRRDAVARDCEVVKRRP